MKAITGEDIDRYRLLAVKQLLKLECLGMRHSSGVSAIRLVEAKAGVKFGRGKAGRLKAIQWIEEVGLRVDS